MGKKFYFWYSSKQSAVRCEQRRRFVMIKGKRVEYTECRESNTKPSELSDVVFLGKAEVKDICK